MKKSTFIFMLLFMITTIGISVNFHSNVNNKFSILFENIEAIASSSEGGSNTVKHTTYGGKQYCKGSSYVTYERLGVGDICLKWNEYKPSGAPQSYCYEYN